MKALIFFFLLAPAVSSAQQLAVTHTSGELGIGVTVPADWEVMDTSALAKEQASQAATTEDEKKGLACVQVALTTRHGNPPSIITVPALPFDCYGKQMTEADLPQFGAGFSAGLQQNFDLGEPVTGSYTLGTHRFWIERVKGTVKSQPEMQYTVETACTITKKAAVCWMAMAADEAGLSAFEHIPVSLDGDAATPLVPANALEQKPQ